MSACCEDYVPTRLSSCVEKSRANITLDVAACSAVPIAINRAETFEEREVRVQRECTAVKTAADSLMQACNYTAGDATPQGTACYVGQDSAKPVMDSLARHCESKFGDTTGADYKGCAVFDNAAENKFLQLVLAQENWLETSERNLDMLRQVREANAARPPPTTS